MKHALLRIVISALCLAAIAGCVSIDTRTWREEVDKEATKNIRSAFLNVPDYRSSGDLLASGSLAEALRLPATNSAWAYIWRISDSEVLVRFVTYGETDHQHVYRAGVDLKITDDQKMVLSVPTKCSGRDSPAFGCSGGSVTLFVNPRGQLAAVESGASGGIIGIIPLATYVKHLTLFRRIEDAPPIQP